MSTRLLTLRDDQSQENLLVTSFWGGIDEGRSIQLTTSFIRDYAHLNEVEVEELVKVLTTWLESKGGD